jgi:hypothetical protein
MLSKRRARKRNRRNCRGGYLVALIATLFLAACVALLAADKVGELQARFDHEAHAGTRVRILEKLSAAQFLVAGQAAKSEDFNTVGFTLEKYRDNVRTCFELLMKQEPDAEKHGESYRHLELQTRRGLREVEEILNTVPPVVQPPLQIVRQDLIGIDDQLIKLLFPRRSKDKDTRPAPPPVENKP